MDRTLLARFRDYAIDHFPAAQIIRDKERAKEKKDNDIRADAKQYAQKQWDSANANISQCQHSEIELVAITLLLDITSWELFEPSPFLDKLAEVHSGDDSEITRDYLESNIYIGVESLNKVTGKNISIISSLVDYMDTNEGNGDEIKNNFEAILAYNDVVRIADAVKKMGCTVEQLLKEAANSERILYVDLKSHSSTLIAIRSHENPLTATHISKYGEIVAMLPIYTELLAKDGSIEIAKYQAGIEPPLDWHYWVLDVPQTIDIDRVYIHHSEVELNDSAVKNDCVQPNNELNGVEQKENTDGKTDNDFETAIRNFLERVISKYPKATSKDIISHCFICYKNNNRQKTKIKNIMVTLGIETDKNSGKRNKESIDYMKNASEYKLTQ